MSWQAQAASLQVLAACWLLWHVLLKHAQGHQPVTPCTLVAPHAAAVMGAPKVISPSKLSGQVFVGRFRSKLGPYQVRVLSSINSCCRVKCMRRHVFLGRRWLPQA